MTGPGWAAVQAGRAATVLEKFLHTRYAFSSVQVSPAGPAVAITLVRGGHTYQFEVPPAVIHAGFLTGCNFVDRQAEEFIRRADASAYGYHFEPRDLAPSAPAPRSPICPCGIDRRDCEYHL